MARFDKQQNYFWKSEEQHPPNNSRLLKNCYVCSVIRLTMKILSTLKDHISVNDVRLDDKSLSHSTPF